MKKLSEMKWKTKKRHSFHFYFTILVGVVILVSVLLSSWLSETLNDLLGNTLKMPEILLLIFFGLVIGIVLSFFVGKFLLSPVKKIRNAMSDVSTGNLDVAISENSLFDEIEDINHAFNIMVKELRSMEIIQSDFVSNVSHEFKTPLTAIEGYASMLKNGDLTDDEIAEYTQKILFNTKRMSELVNNILLLSKLDNQGIESKKETFSLDEQIRREILATERKWNEKNLDFDVKLDCVDYCGNSGLISHIWSNLLGNAIKFSPENGKITLELTKKDGCVEFSVSDEGEGIKEDAKKYIFNKFYQSDTSHKQEGNGLGLALVKKITNVYGGEVETENLSPKGCKFTIRLPM